MATRSLRVAIARQNARSPRSRPSIARGFVFAAPIVLAFALVGILILLPLVTVFAQAFANGVGPALDIFRDPYAQSAMRLTLVVAVCTVAFNSSFGVLAAWTLTKYRFPGKALLVTLIDVPLMVSPVVAGLAILLSVGKRTPFGAWMIDHGVPIAFAPPGIVIATIFVTFPYVARELTAFMQERGRELEEAALSLGASVWQTLVRVTLPSAKWALLDGALLCNARAMGEFGAVSVISGRIRGLTDTVPLHIEILYNENAFVGAFALSSLLAIVAMSLTSLRALAQRRAERAHD